MELFRLHAYTVIPTRTDEEASPPAGGAVNPPTELRAAFLEISDASRTGARTEVDFDVDTETRTNEVRDHILRFAFENPAAAKVAASWLAARLGGSMDRRSDPCLLVLAALRDGSRRRVAISTFPRDEAFRLRTSKGTPSIELLKDVFSRTSRLRKAAFFEGMQRRTDFLRGLIFDSQAMSAAKEAADFWIVSFLQCVLAFHGAAGTRHLAKSLQAAYGRADDPHVQEQLSAAIMALRHSPRRRLSLQGFADDYLSEPAKKAFLEAIPNDAVLGTPFDLDREVLDSTLRYRMFRLDTDVFVTAPLDAIGQSVTVTGEGPRRRLRCEGEIRDERVRSRHG